MKKKWLEVAVVASRLNVSAMTVYRLINSKKLEGRKFGTVTGIRVARESVEMFEDSRKIGM